MTTRIIAVALLLAAMVVYCDCSSWFCGSSSKQIEQTIPM